MFFLVNEIMWRSVDKFVFLGKEFLFVCKIIITYIVGIGQAEQGLRCLHWQNLAFENAHILPINTKNGCLKKHFLFFRQPELQALMMTATAFFL